jgi:phosphate transport system permease protein
MATLESRLRSGHLRLWQDRIFITFAWGLGLLGLMLPVSIILFLLYHGAAAINWDLLWQSPKGFPLGGSGGIRPAIEGSLALVAIGLTVALPFALGGAIYLTEYSASDRLRRAVSFCGECLAGVPAIIYGLFGYSFLAVFVRLRVSLLAGGITLGLVMLPIMLIGAYEALRAVDGKYREAALALGVSRLYAFRKNVWPKARGGLLAAVVLAAGHAFGCAAPVLLTASVVLSKGGLDLSAPVMTLPTHLYYLVSEGSSLQQAYATALILVSLLLTANVTVMLIKDRQGRQGVR